MSKRRVRWSAHLLHIRDLQERTGGFTEFVPLPFVHMEAPMHLKGLSRKGPTWREVLLMHAVARLALNPLITNIQASWVKLGPDGVRQLLRAGVNDLGGTLMNESISRAAGTQHGQELPPDRDGSADPVRRPHAAPAHHALSAPPPEAHRRSFARCGACADRADSGAAPSGTAHRGGRVTGSISW